MISGRERGERERCGVVGGSFTNTLLIHRSEEMWEELQIEVAELSEAQHKTWRLHGRGRRNNLQPLLQNWEQVPPFSAISYPFSRDYEFPSFDSRSLVQSSFLLGARP